MDQLDGEGGVHAPALAHVGELLRAHSLSESLGDGGDDGRAVAVADLELVALVAVHDGSGGLPQPVEEDEELVPRVLLQLGALQHLGVALNFGHCSTFLSVLCWRGSGRCLELEPAQHIGAG